MYTELIESSSPCDDIRTNSNTHSGTSSSGNINNSLGQQLLKQSRSFAQNLQKTTQTTVNSTQTNLSNSHQNCSNTSSSNKDIYGQFQSFPTSSCSSNDLNTGKKTTHSSQHVTTSSTHQTQTQTQSIQNVSQVTANLQQATTFIQHQQNVSMMSNMMNQTAMVPPMTPIVPMPATPSVPRGSPPSTRPNKLSVTSEISQRCPAIDSYGQVSKDFDSNKHDNGDHMLLLNVLGEAISKIFKKLNVSNSPLLSIALDQGRPPVFRIYTTSPTSPRSSAKTVRNARESKSSPKGEKVIAGNFSLFF